MGFNPRLTAVSRSISTTAAAASLMLDALPAVTDPAGSNTGRSFARRSRPVPGRGDSSTSNGTLSFLTWMSTGTICARK